MGIDPRPCGSCQPQERRAADRHATADPAKESKTMTVRRRHPRLPKQPRQLGAGPFEPQIGSFRLHLAAEGKRPGRAGLHLGGALVRRRLPARPGPQDYVETIGTGEGLPGQVIRRAPRCRDHRGVHRDRHPAVRAGRDPLPPGTTPPATTLTCKAGRSGSAARAAGPGPSRSATRRPAASTATCAPAPGTRKRTGRSCSWESATVGR